MNRSQHLALPILLAELLGLICLLGRIAYWLAIGPSDGSAFGWHRCNLLEDSNHGHQRLQSGDVDTNP